MESVTTAAGAGAAAGAAGVAGENGLRSNRLLVTVLTAFMEIPFA